MSSRQDRKRAWQGRPHHTNSQISSLLTHWVLSIFPCCTVVGDFLICILIPLQKLETWKSSKSQKCQQKRPTFHFNHSFRVQINLYLGALCIISKRPHLYTYLLKGRMPTEARFSKERAQMLKPWQISHILPLLLYISSAAPIEINGC